MLRLTPWPHLFKRFNAHPTLNHRRTGLIFTGKLRQAFIKVSMRREKARAARYPVITSAIQTFAIIWLSPTENCSGY